MPIVLVTGATGHTAIFTIIQYLKRGYTVNATLRDASKSESVLKLIKDTGCLSNDEITKLKLFEADLGKPEGWNKAIEGVEYVCHLAYPFINYVPLEQIYDAAVTGTLNLLKLAEKTPSVKYFIFCSSFGACGFGDSYPEGTVIDETFWTPEDAKALDGYLHSKIIVERKMWEFIKGEENKSGLEFCSIVPFAIAGKVPKGYTKFVGVFGLLAHYFSGQAEAVVDFPFSFTDVEDLAKAFVDATKKPEARGERILILNEYVVQVPDIVASIKKYAPSELSSKLPKQVAPYFKPRKATVKKARKLLNFEPTPWEQTFKDSVEGVAAYVQSQNQ